MAKRHRSESNPFAEFPVAVHEAYQDLRASYAAGSSGKFRPRVRGVNYQGSGADYHIRDQNRLMEMIERSREFDRNDMVVAQGVDRVLDNVLQDEGFSVDPLTTDKGVNKELKARWYDWEADPEKVDNEGEKDFLTIQRLTLRGMIVDGDPLDLLLATGQIQSIEAHRLRTPTGTTQKNVVCGVKLSQQGRREAYWISKRDIDPLDTVKLVGEVEQYPARDKEGHRNVLHHYDPRRMSQTRGITRFAPIVDAIGMHGDLQFATLVKAQLASCFAIIEERGINTAGNAHPAGSAPKTGSETSESQYDGSARDFQEVRPGMRIVGRMGSQLKGFSPNIPNAEFFPHSLLILTFIAINLGLPVHVLLLDPSRTNFSGWRGAIDEARKGWRRLQMWLIKSQSTPVYKWQLRHWIADDPALARSAERLGASFFAHRFVPPSWRYIEPLKDASADLLQVRNALTSHRRRAQRLGEDWDDLSSEIVADNAKLIRKAKRAAIKINKEFPGDGSPVTWLQLASLPTPDGVSMSVSADSNDASPTTDDNREEPKRD